MAKYVYQIGGVKKEYQFGQKSEVYVSGFVTADNEAQALQKAKEEYQIPKPQMMGLVGLNGEGNQ